MSAHTPGPWRAIDTRVYFPNLQGGFDIRDCPAPHANARLIAAAPDMLEALKDLQAIRAQCFIPNDGNWLDNKISAAIKKAEGGE